MQETGPSGEAWYDPAELGRLLAVCRKVVAVAGAAVCHDVNNPLQGVVGFADLLLQDEGQPGRRDLEMIFHSAREVQALLARLGDLAGEHPPEPVPVDTEGFCRAVLETWPVREYELAVEDAVAEVATDPVYFLLLLRGLTAPVGSGRLHLDARIQDGRLELRAEWVGEGLVANTGARGLDRGLDLWLGRRAARLLGGSFLEQGGEGSVCRVAAVPIEQALGAERDESS